MTDTGTLLSDYLGIQPQTTEAAVLRLLIETGANVVGAEEGSLLVLDEGADVLRFVMTVGSEESEKALIGQKVPLGQGITGLAASTHEVQIGAPTFKDIKQSEKRGGKEGAPEAVLAAPMLIGDALVGVITAVSFVTGKRFVSKDAKLYGQFASIAGVVVDQRRRLTAREKAAGADVAEPMAFGEDERIEQKIIAAISRIAGQRPAALAQVADVVSAIESIILPEEEVEI